MLDWHSCQICYPLEIKILLLLCMYILLRIKVGGGTTEDCQL